jgi:DNA-binding NarL/FixJ family response regulator
MTFYKPHIYTALVMTPKRESSAKRSGRISTTEKGEILSVREKEVLHELSLGKTYHAIGETLFISTETVRTHAHKIYNKLEVKNRTEAINKFYGNDR